MRRAPALRDFHSHSHAFTHSTVSPYYQQGPEKNTKGPKLRTQIPRMSKLEESRLDAKPPLRFTETDPERLTICPCVSRGLYSTRKPPPPVWYCCRLPSSVPAWLRGPSTPTLRLSKSLLLSVQLIQAPETPFNVGLPSKGMGPSKPGDFSPTVLWRQRYTVWPQVLYTQPLSTSGKENGKVGQEAGAENQSAPPTKQRPRFESQLHDFLTEDLE